LDGEIRLLLHRLLADLPDRQRIVVTLRDVEGYTADEVCSMLELSIGNQRVLLHRGRATVRAGLERYLSAPDGGPARVGVP
jgi:RNA polymerase sigma-70 factor (ECF subfamily)